MRTIFLPELLSIKIKHYTLYPQGLDYHFHFVKGVNLVLGGNGMGKTTFVNIVRFGLIGLYKKQLDYTRTYKGEAVIKRQLNPPYYFANRMDDTIATTSEPIVILTFKLNKSKYVVERNLKTGKLTSVYLNNVLVGGNIVSEDKYEKMSDEEKRDSLNWSYEQSIFNDSNLTFDDLIFFVNEILFFGESHKTVLWNEAGDGKADVQTELFNKYFNEPDLDKRRQEAQRQARYYDSLSRHKSEDMRAINNLIKKMNLESQKPTEEQKNLGNIINLKDNLERIKGNLESIEKSRKQYSKDIAVLQSEINAFSLQTTEIDKKKEMAEKALNTKMWERLHPSYNTFLENIQLNHLCPMCNHTDEPLFNRVNSKPNYCFVCENELKLNEDPILLEDYKRISLERRDLYQSIATKKKKILAIEDELLKLDNEFKQADLKRREVLQQIREIEYQQSKNDNPSSIQAIYDELYSLQKAKEQHQRDSEIYSQEENKLTRRIEEEILNNVSRFSSIFASYAESFLGVKCQLTYDKPEWSDTKRFFPLIDGKIRWDEESLSESQRFFIDHSFRMSILSFFYQTPSFYIVETPDSSLDISYENNAAKVFLKFLEKPNSIIVTSNLNNSSFVGHLIQDKSKPFAMVGLLDIAKQSAIQNTSEQLKNIYFDIKNQIRQ